MPPRLEHLHIVPRRRGEPLAIDDARVRPGRGLPGDHHDREGIRRPITAVRAETLDEVARALGVEVAPGASRRNLTLRGVALDTLPPGTRLAIGTATLEITGPCDPCARMEAALGPGALALMEKRGGVVLKVVRAGTLKRGDAIEITPPAPEKPPASRRNPRRPRPPAPSEPVLPAGGPKRVRALQHGLRAWFQASKRDLPWRRSRDAYGVWLSEVMLQQTQVATVIPYWEKFLARFPTVRVLAAASLDEVLPYWSGLGYYARCRNLHRAAKALVERHDGVFPADPAALEALPGFGPYTAGAVGSIALGLDAALVDGNVARVFCRLEGWELGAEAAREKAWRLAPALVPAGDAGDWNQALMELGATVCTPAAPKCGSCPVQAHCLASARGEAARYPLAKERRPKKLLALAALAVRHGGRLLLVRRADEGLFGGLWELPSAELSADAEPAAAARELAGRLACDPGVRFLGRVEQTLTHREVVVDVFEAAGAGSPPGGARWVGPDEIREFGLSTLSVKLLQAANFALPEGYGRRRAVGSSQRALF
jgi:A/G-specific adenine glycosylase